MTKTKNLATWFGEEKGKLHTGFEIAQIGVGGFGYIR